VAAEFASPCSAGGEAEVSVWLDDVVGALVFPELPQPASSAAPPQMTNKLPMHRRAMPEIVVGFA
jgi:hypothetical protein